MTYSLSDFEHKVLIYVIMHMMPSRVYGVPYGTSDISSNAQSGTKLETSESKIAMGTMPRL